MSRACAIALLALAACGGEPSVDPGNAKQVALGKAVYEKHCASCHGVNLEGQADWKVRRENGRLPAPPHDASGHSWHHTDEVLFQITKKGVAAMAGGGYESDMPAFEGKLSDDEIRACIAYIKSTWPAAVLAKQPGAKGAPKH
jgi:mono/diheme cytochrome c family protein